MRKVLSFVLVLSLVLGSFSMAFAATPATGLSDIKGIANEDAIQVNFDLGIVTGNPDGTFLPTKAVNRAEFAAMITRALAIPDSALAGYTTTSFKDTVGYGWAVPYLAFCQSKGIMLGDGMGNAMPGRTITTNEAMTMALRAIGYTANSAELVGAWPSNYVTLAQNNDLYDDVAAVVSVDKANAAQIIYNLLTVQKVAVNSDGETKSLWVGKESDDKAATLLNTGLGCEALDAMILDNSNTGDAKINMTPYLGAYAIVYVDSDDDIIAVGEVKSTFLKGDFDFAKSELEVGDVTYTNVKVATLSTTPEAVTFVNADDTLTNGAVELTTDGTITIAAKVSGKKVTTIYSAAAWSLTHASTESTAFMFDDDLDLDDNEIAGISFPEDDNDAIDYDKFILTGVTDLDKIAKDNVIYVYTNDAGDITKLAVGTETVKGKITKINTDGEPTIGGKLYEVSGAPNAETTMAVAETGTAYLDASGKIYKWDADDSKSGNYAIVIGSESATGALSDGRIKLLDKAGEEKIYTVDIDGMDGTTVATIAADGDLVEFSLDKDGDIDDITNINASVSAVQSGNGTLSATGKVFDGRSVEPGVVVFTFDGTDGYEVVALADVERDADIIGGNYVGTYTPAGGKIEVMIIDADNTDTESVYAVLNSVEDAVNDDDDEVQFISGFAGGATFEAYTDDDSLIDPLAFTTGTLYVLDVDADGVVVDATPLVAIQGSLDDYESGTITDKDGNYDVEIGGQFYTIDSKAVVYQLDTEEDEYVKKAVSSLKDGDLVYMWQTDEDSEQFDVIVYVRP